MFEKEFGTISQLALDAKFSESVDDQKQLLKKIQIEVNNLVHGFKNGVQPMSPREEDLRAVVDLLGARHPGLGVVWEKKEWKDIVRVSHWGVGLPEWLFLTLPKNYTGGVETDDERRKRIVTYIERQLHLDVL